MHETYWLELILNHYRFTTPDREIIDSQLDENFIIFKWLESNLTI